MVPDPSDRTLAVMDLHQEQIARSLGEGHRIIRGVAGSGKTLILAFRAEYLARAATKPVLILCYANGIAGRLEDTMQSRGVEDRVQVRTFHSWCYWMLRTYGIPAPSEREYPDYEKRLAASVSEVVKAVDQGHIPTEQYDAVLIDEAHDFEPQWLALAGPSGTRQACLRVCAGRQGTRHSRPPGLSRTLEYPAHSALHRADPYSVQKLLAGLTARASKHAFDSGPGEGKNSDLGPRKPETPNA